MTMQRNSKRHFFFQKKYFILYATLIMQSLLTVTYANCSVNINPVSFGNYDVFSGGTLETTSTISVQCHPSSISYTISMDAGLYGPINSRMMQAAGGSNNNIRYNLYIDPSRTIIWGNGSANSQVVTSSSTTPINVYAQVAANQNAGVGSYSDAVTVNVDF